MQIRELPLRHCDIDFGLENALARYVRRKWPTRTIQHVQHEWGLSEGLARGVVYGTATRRAINEINRHKTGGPLFLAERLAEAVGSTLLREAEQRRANERKSWERVDQGLSDMARHLRIVGAGDRHLGG